MSGYILCQNKVAQKPYYIEHADLNIYSIEELCYYLYENIYLADESLLNDTLYQWLDQEVGLPELAVKLRKVVDINGKIPDLLQAIAKEGNYFNYEAMKNFHVRLMKLHKEDLTIRMKKKGDCLVENGRYAKAIDVYQKVLSQKNITEMKVGFDGMIWYNMGCVHSYLFQKEKALKCFEKAYEILHSGTTLKSYFLLYAEVATKEEYEEKLNEMGVDEKTREEIQALIEENKKNVKIPSVEPENIGEILGKLTKEYHKNLRN